jgi:hypothetical protein
MPRAARKSKQVRVASNDDIDIEVGDVTNRVYPEGVPQAPDGQVADEGSIPVEQARQIGAVTAGAAAMNKRVARQIDKASKGEPVSWNEDDPLQLFDNIRAAWPSLSIRIFIKATDSDETYPPVLMGSFKTNADFYDYLLKNVHRNKKSTKYEITFKAGGNYSNRGKGFIILPDMSEEVHAATPPTQQQWNPYTQRWELVQAAPPPPVGYGAPPPAFNTPYGYSQQPPQQPVPQASSPTPNVHIHNPPPQPQQPQPVQQPQVIPAPIPPSMDPNIASWMQAQIEGQNALRLQLAEALGAIRDRQANPPPPPVQQPAVAAVPVAPPGYRLVPEAPPASYQPPPGYRLVPEAAPTPQGVGAPPPSPQMPPPPPPPPVQAAPRAPGPLGIDIASVVGAIQGLEQLRKVVNYGQPAAQHAAPEEEEEDIVPVPVQAPPPVTTTPLGSGENPMVYVTNPDGSINTAGMVMGNLHKVPEFLQKIAQGVASINKNIDEAAARRPIQAQAISSVPVEPRRMPTTQIIETPRQQSSMLPNIPRP